MAEQQEILHFNFAMNGFKMWCSQLRTMGYDWEQIHLLYQRACEDQRKHEEAMMVNLITEQK